MLEQILAKTRQMVKDAQQLLPAESAAAIEIVYGEIVNLNNLIIKKLNSIENNINLSTSAQKAARRKVLEKAARKLEILKSKRNYSPTIARLEEKLPRDPGRKEDPILRFMREKEIRDRLVGMTERQILSHFGDSLFDGSNPLLMDAVLKAPSGFEILPEEDLRRMREIRIKKLDPKVAAEIQTVRNLENVVIKMFDLVKDELDRLRKRDLPSSIAETLSTEDDSS
jgi:hypothetical protein